MFNPSYLTLSRHNLYYFRFPLPASIHPQGRRTDIKMSLDTRCPQEALHMIRCLAYYADNALTNPILNMMDYHDIREALTAHFKAMRDQVKERIAEQGQLTTQEQQAFKNGAAQALQSIEGLSDLVGNASDLAQVIEGESLDVNPSSPEYQTLKTEYTKAYRDYCSSVLEYNSRFDGYNFKTDPESLAMRKSVSRMKRKSLSDTIDAYIEERKAVGAWSDKTANENRSQFNLLLEYLGKDASLHLSSDVANDVKRMLLRLPKQSRTNPKYSKMTIQQLLELDKVKRLDVATISKTLRIYSTFYDWAVKRKDTDENNFKGLLEAKKDKGQKRDAFSDAQINLMLAEAIGNEDGYISKPYQKWGTLIGIYTGARLNEVAQLALDDVQEIEGVWCFSFNDVGEGKRLKTIASKRIVPIHSKLIECGFLDYVTECRKTKKDRVLYDLTFSGQNGYGRNLSRWFNDVFLKKLGIKTDRLVFHSLRHTAVTKLLQAGVEEPIVKTLIGHAQEGVTQNVYAKGYKISQLKQAIDNL